MKLMALSGVFVLASAGLALATVEAAAPDDTVKPVTASLVAGDAPEAVIAEKKADLPAEVTLVGVACTADAARPDCIEPAAKN